jgi:hypothetical protein
MWFGPICPDPTMPNDCTPPTYENCCDAMAAIKGLQILPTNVWAVRNHRYKLVRSKYEQCDGTSTGCEFEFYDLQPTLTNPLGLDLSTNNLLADCCDPSVPPSKCLDAEQMANYAILQAYLMTTLASEQPCYADGNLDKLVNIQDFVGVQTNMGRPSVFDFNADGITNDLDLACVLANMGNNCLVQGSGQDCDSD